MRTLLVLGSKPEPVLPPAGSWDALACANASGASAARLGLARPAFTVVSTILASRTTPSNAIALAALRGLSTGTLFIYPRRPYRGNRLKQIANAGRVLRATPWFLRRELARVDYHYDRTEVRSSDAYAGMILALSGNDGNLTMLMRRKPPSSGVVAVALGLSDPAYTRVVVSGFSFQITHAYAENPDIRLRGSAESRHADTDIAVITALSHCTRRLYTTEPIVNERTGVPLLGE
ncbi:MAG: hypothetical protein KF815_08925 [Rhodospirillales bacterium]|nr:hypothetical protein [Rhodospirillales bacterium]